MKCITLLIDSDSGVGCQIAVADLDKDGKTDIAIGNKKGVFVFQTKLQPTESPPLPWVGGGRRSAHSHPKGNIRVFGSADETFPLLKGFRPITLPPCRRIRETQRNSWRKPSRRGTDRPF